MVVVYVLNLYEAHKNQTAPIGYHQIVEAQSSFTKSEMIARMLVPKRQYKPLVLPAQDKDV